MFRNGPAPLGNRRQGRRPAVGAAVGAMPPAAAAAASKWSSIKPAAIKTWVRIRPLAAEEEKGGHGDGERVEKELGAYLEDFGTILLNFGISCG